MKTHFSSLLRLIVCVGFPLKIVQEEGKRRIVIRFLLFSQGMIVSGGLFEKTIVTIYKCNRH